uniref:Uncharacterized protein n=1 Tax=Acrobeloides nanus TaxID=290746 RepID=A0A914D412_9BILA
MTKNYVETHLLGHRVDFYPEFIDEKTHQELLKILKGMKVFPTNAQDLQFYNTTYEHIGESEPLDPELGCTSRYLVPNAARTLCILPNRFDLAKHFMTYGGIDGLKENFEMLASRMQSFGRYIFDIKDYPVMENLFYSEEFIRSAKKICPINKQVLDPFQFHFIIQIPGQTLPVHLDAQYLEHATRFQYPTWLPVVMAGSGIYQDNVIDQVQGVAYLHEWNDTSLGGHLSIYNKDNNNPDYEIPYPRGVGLMDGAKTMHASTVFRPNDHLPILPKNAKNELVYQEDDDIWELRSDDKVLNKYQTTDFRITLVYRSRCFESEEKRQRFLKWHKSGENVRPVEVVLDELKTELVKKYGYNRESLDSISKIDLANALTDTFLKYPLPTNAIIPLNYCALPVIFPSTQIIFDWIC